MQTSSLRTYHGPGRISIARSARGIAPGFKVYRPLQPGPWFRSVDFDEYHRLYDNILAQLDPQQVWDELHALAAPHEPILLCWEVPHAPPAPAFDEQNWCHRRLASAWFEQRLGVSVPELPPQ